MVNFLERDQNKRKIINKFELKRIEYKSYINDLTIPKHIRYKYTQKLNKLPRNSSPVRIRNRCTLTGRGRGVFSFFKLSRIAIRQLAGEGALNGVKKSSW